MTTARRVHTIGPIVPATGERDPGLIQRVLLERQRRALLPDDRTPFPDATDAAPKARQRHGPPRSPSRAGLRKGGEI